MDSRAPQIGIFALAEQKLAWIDARQRLLAQNVANADTPGYHARDLRSFSDVLGAFGVEMARTSPLHLAALSGPTLDTRDDGGERAPDGNSVQLEQEMTKIADNEGDQAATGNIWRSYMGMFMTALGHAS